MRRTIFFLLLFWTVIGHSQITIDSSHMPKSGDSLQYSIAVIDTNILFNFQDTGANLQWDYSSLIPIRQGVSEYLTSSQTPYSAAIKNRIAEKLADTLVIQEFEILDVFEFYKNDSNEFAKDYRAGRIPTGLPFIPFFEFPLPYRDKDEIYQFPLEYKDRDSSTYEFVLDTNLVILSIYYGTKGYRINEVDAWGELITPYDTFNCIRVVSDIVGYDTINFADNDFGIESHTREYKWLTQDLSIPALTISGQVINDSIFIPVTVQYRDSSRGLPGLLAPIALFNADSTRLKINQSTTIQNLTVSIIPTQYKWDISPNTFSYLGGTNSNSADSIIVNFTDTGNYDVQLIARNSDGRDTLLLPSYFRVEAPTGLFKNWDSKISAPIRIYPNPLDAASTFNLEIPYQMQFSSAYLVDANGRIVSDVYIPRPLQNSIEIKAPELPGLYFIILQGPKGPFSKQLIVGKNE